MAEERSSCYNTTCEGEKALLSGGLVFALGQHSVDSCVQAPSARDRLCSGNMTVKEVQLSASSVAAGQRYSAGKVGAQQVPHRCMNTGSPCRDRPSLT